MKYLTYLIILWNIIVFLTYGTDKLCAIKGFRRISEKTLICFAFLLGGIGALLGMRCFHHKTKHINFKIAVPAAFVITAAALVYSAYFI